VIPFVPPTTQFVFANPGGGTPVEVTISEGGAAQYYKVANNTITADGTATDYNIKVTFETGKNPTVYLKNFNMTVTDAHLYSTITIGSATNATYNDVAVDIVVEAASNLSHARGSGYGVNVPLIDSYITETLTITSDFGASLYLGPATSAGGKGAIRSVGDILLKDATVETGTYWGSRKGEIIYSTAGNITVEGGQLTINTKGANSPSYSALRADAAGKNIYIRDNATVTITIPNADKAFGTNGDVIIDNSSVFVTVTGAGTIFSANAPVIQGYGANGYVATGDGADYNAANFATYKAFSVTPFVPPTTQFVFANPGGGTPVEVTISEGGAAQYYKVANNTITADGTATDYNIKVTFETGKNPTVYLKNFNMTITDAHAYSTITIGSATNATYNDVAVDIVVEEATALSTAKGTNHYANVPLIDSYITKTLTVTSESDALLKLTPRISGGNRGAIRSAGDILLKNANVSIKSDWSGYKSEGIYSIAGNITVEGGQLTLNSSGAANMVYSVIRAEGAGKNITIKDSAMVTITIPNQHQAFGTNGDVVINNSSVFVTVTGNGTIFGSKAPVIEGYGADGYIAKGDGADYNAANFATYKAFSVIPFVPPTTQFVFANPGGGTPVEVTISEGGAAQYYKVANNTITADGTATDYNIKVTFETGKNPTVYLKNFNMTITDAHAYSTITIGSATNATYNDYAVDIVVEEATALSTAKGTNHYANVPLIDSYITKTLTVTSKSDALLKLTPRISGGNRGAIRSAGDILLKNANVSIVSDWSNYKSEAIYSIAGNITVEGGQMNLNSSGAADMVYPVIRAEGAGKNITIKGGALVTITIPNQHQAFGTNGDVVINNSSVFVTVTGNGTIFNGKAPVIEGYGTDGYVAKGDGAKYNAANFATYKAFSVTPFVLSTTQFVFANPGGGTPVEVTISEGGAAQYYKVANNTITADGTATDYNIKVTYETGKNPTIYLKNFKMTVTDQHLYSTITIGSTTNATYNDVAVDIVVEAASDLSHAKGSGYGVNVPLIDSYITQTLTITSTNEASLYLGSATSGGGRGAIRTVSDILLKNANISTGTYWSNRKGEVIYSTAGNIIVEGGQLTLNAKGANSPSYSVLRTDAEGKNIYIRDSATVLITIANSDKAFSTKGDVIINNASVAVNVSGNGSIFSGKAPVIEGYGEKGYVAKGDGADYNAANFATYKSFSVKPYSEPAARIVFKNQQGETLEYNIKEGADTIYLRTVGGVVVTTDASADKYNIKITFEKGKNPRIYLNGASITTHGNAKGDSAIIIGSNVATDACNDISVDIVVEKNSSMNHEKTYGAPHIQSYITGTLTITRIKGSLTLNHKMVRGDGVINAVGDILLKNANIVIASNWSGKDRANYIRSTNGNITVDAGNLSITTNGDGNLDSKPISSRVLLTEGNGKNITFQNGAKVTITVRNAFKTFGTKGSVIFDNATVKINVTGDGSIFDATAPVIKGYPEGTVALGDDKTYDPAQFATYKSFSIEGGDPVMDESYDYTDTSGSGNGGSGNGGSGNGGSGSPNTGDSTNLELLITLVVISAFGFVALVLFGKKRFATK